MNPSKVPPPIKTYLISSKMCNIKVIIRQFNDLGYEVNYHIFIYMNI